ncbi:MAG: molybdate ABC transporter substrate-binding protein [Fimbriimonadaceae bacterium]
MPLRFVLSLALLATGALANAQTLTVLAAASLRETFTEMSRVFEADHPGVRVRTTFAGSQQLAASILLDAPADVFVSADEAQMNRVLAGGKARQGSWLCSNRLVVVMGHNAVSRIRSLADLGQPGLRVVLAQPKVPAGAYADFAIGKLPASQAAAIRANVRSREVDVRTVLTRVELGEADAGIVYTTDVASAHGRVSSVPIPVKLQSPVIYVIAALSRSPAPGLAAAFVKLALAKQGQAMLHAHGFLPAPKHRR